MDMRLRWMIFTLAAVQLGACRGEQGAAPKAASDAASAPAAAARSDDLVIRRRASGSQIAEPAESTVYLSGTKRITDEPRRRIVYDLAGKTATIIQKDRQAYFVVTFDQVLEQRHKLNQRFESLPLEDRKQAGFDKEMTLTATDKVEKIAGYDAKEHLVAGGPVTGSVWLTEAIRYPPAWRGHELIIANVENTGYVLRRLSESVAALNGYPLKLALTMNIKGQQVSMLSEVVEVRTGSAPPELLVAPADFRKAELPPA
jgi:hypothetical protein